MRTPDWASDDGAVRLYRGDAMEVLPTLEPGSADAVVTDPPYGIADKPMLDLPGRAGGNNNYHPATDWDDAIDPRWCAECERVAPIVAWFGQWRKRGEVEAAFTAKLRAEIVWAKDTHVGPPCPLARRDERIWLFSRSGVNGVRFDTTVWDEPIIPTWAHRHHKNEKPIGLMIRLVSWIPSNVVLDPFMGSGSTGVACVKTGRPFVGIEINPDYFNIAVRRIQAAIDEGALYRQAEREPDPELFAEGTT